MADSRELEREATRILRRDANKEAAKRYRDRKKQRMMDEAVRITAGLTEEQVKAGIGLTAKDIKRLNDIVHRPKRHSLASLAALNTKMRYTLAQPRQEIGGEIGVQVVVQSLREDGEAVTVALPATAVGAVTTASLPARDEDEDAQ